MNFEDFSFIGKSGRGVFASVGKYKHYKYGVVALKKINSDTRFKKSGLNEISILKNLKEKDKYNIIHFYDSFIYNGIQYLVLEHINTNLYTFLKKEEYDFQKSVSILKKILVGLNYLHENNIIHSDLKPENILYDDSIDYLKIIDFGSSIVNKEKKPNFYIQSRYYRAVEVIFNLDFDYKIDIWSFGCIAYELVLKNELFKAHNQKYLIEDICYAIGYPKNDEYINSEVFGTYFGYNINTNMYLKCRKKCFNIELGILDTELSIKLARKFKYVNFNIRNNFIDMILDVITYDYKTRPDAKTLLEYRIFNS